MDDAIGLTEGRSTEGDPIWPSQSDIVRSDLFGLLRGRADHDRVLRTLMAVVLRYAYSECLFLACALAREAGEPVGIARFSIAVPGDAQRLLHAVLVRGTGPFDARRDGHDILGTATLGTLHTGMVGFGAVTPDLMPRAEWAEWSDYEGDQRETALAVAGCLPWLTRFVPARYRIDRRFAPDRLADLVRGPGFERYRMKDPDHEP